MHPVAANDPLQVKMCANQIIALQQCHREWKKWWGGCNDVRAELDVCLRADKVIRRTRNMQNSVDYQDRIHQRDLAAKAAKAAAEKLANTEL